MCDSTSDESGRPDSELVFRYSAKQPVNWYRRDPRGSNQYCLYCGALVGEGATVLSNKEHLVARNFVPAGTLHGQAFNFIFRACVACNARKANAERHVSSATLLTSGSLGADPRVDSAALRKGERDFAPGMKATPIKDATVQHDVVGRYGAASFTFGLVGPPQLSREAVALLACNHIQAVFALITTPDPRLRGGSRLLPATNWHMFGSFPANDWGNPQLLTIVDRVRDWPITARIITADGYFKLIMRTRSEPEEWFWALEWNRSLRVLGAIYHAGKEPPLFEGLRKLKWINLPGGSRLREETPLGAQADRLFED